MTSNFIQLAAPWEPKKSLIFRGLLFTHILMGLQPSRISWVFWGPKVYIYIYIHIPLIYVDIALLPRVGYLSIKKQTNPLTYLLHLSVL